MTPSPAFSQSKDERPRPAPRRWPVYVVAGLALLVGAYAAFGFWAAPALIRRAVIGQVAQRYHRTASLGEVRLNPFTLRLEANGFSLTDADGRPMIAFRRLTVRLSPASLWRGGADFSEIALDAPQVRIVRRPDGRLNLQDLAPPPAKPEAGGKPPKLIIDHLSVRRGEVGLTDLDRPRPLVETFNRVNFVLNDFSTVKDGADYRLRAQTDRGERLAWRGRFGLSPLKSAGDFQLRGFQARPLAAIAGDALPFGVSGGRIDLDGAYDFALAGRVLKLGVDVSDLSLTNAGLRARGADADWIVLPALVVSAVHVDVADRSVRVGRIEATGPSVSAWTGRGGTLNLARYAPAPARAARPPGPSGPAWRVALPDVRVNGGHIAFEDRSAARPVKVMVSPLNVAVTGFSLPLKAPIQLDLNAGLDDGGRVAAKGPVDLDSASADLDVVADNVGLRRLQPYVDRLANLELLSGKVSLKGRVVYAVKSAAFEGAVSVDDLHTVDKTLHEDFINWRSLRFDGVRARSQPLSISVDQVTAEAPYARVAISPTYVVNVQAVLNPPGADHAPRKPAADNGAVQPTETAAAPGDEAVGSETAPAAATPPVPAPPIPAPAPRKALPIAIKLVRIENGRMDYSDLSVEPHFAAGIDNLKGTIKGLSGRADSRASVDLTGQVDRYAPVKITGQINYFAAKSFTDMTMSFQNMELTSFSPYSGKFAGYRIDKGKLNVDLHYLIDDQKLDAMHHIVVDQLELGDKVDSASAVKLPVKLIVALLKDRNGVIDLPIEVVGTLDDPRFKLWPLIWKVVDNLLVKVATAPFALLGHLVGGGEELSYIDFSPGAAVLDDAGRQKLAALAKALAERPAVNLDIPMTEDPGVDRPAMIEARLEAELAAAADGGKRASQPGAVDPALATPRGRRRILERLYRGQFGAKPDIPKPQAPEGAVKPDADQAAVAWLETQLRARISVSDQDLAQLGRARARVVQNALLSDGQINPGRIFVVTEPPQAAPAVRMTLSLN